MPKLKTETTAKVTTVAEVTLKPSLKKKLDLLLSRYQTRAKELAELKKLQEESQDEIETAFIDAGEYNTLLAGVKIGDIPVKRVEGQTYKKLDKPALMKRFKITPAQWAEYESEHSKKGYLSISLPKQRGNDDDDE